MRLIFSCPHVEQIVEKLASIQTFATSFFDNHVIFAAIAAKNNHFANKFFKKIF